MSDEPTRRHFVSQRLRLAYADWGNDAAPPLILVHGGLDHARNWDWAARGLRERWHVVAPDLRGHGDSEWPSSGEYAPFAFVADLAMLVRHLGGGPVRLLGHSLGGNIALRYTALYPESVTRLVAIEGLGPAPALVAARDARDPADRLREWIARHADAADRTPRRYATLAEAEARMRAAHPGLDEERIARLTFHGVRAAPGGGFVWKFDDRLRIDDPIDLATDRLRALWSRITCPTLLVYGRDSWASNPAEDGRLADLPTARVSLYDRAGHWVQHDRCADLITEVAEFLDD